MKVVFLGSPVEVSPVLEELIQLDQSGRIELVGVISQPAKPAGRKRKLQDPPIAALAKERGLLVMQPEKCRDEDFIAELKKLEADVYITAAYGQILSQDFLDTANRATINIHPSALPAYRGATPVQSALLDGLKQTAVTILFTVKALDAGAIIAQKDVVIEDHETALELMPRLFKVGADMLAESLDRLTDKSFRGEEQDPSLVTHCRKIKKEDGQINWQNSRQEIYNRYRAFHPWPGSFTFLDGKRVSILELKPLTEEVPIEALAPGEFQYFKPQKAVLIGCGQGEILKASLLKPEGSKQLDAPSFWNGLKGIKRGQFQ